MKKFLVCTMLLALCPLLLIAQAPDTVWTKTYGGTGDDFGYSIQQTPDGQFIITGYVTLPGSSDTDVWLLRTNNNGDTLWTKTYGGSEDDEGRSVDRTTDGGYSITGKTHSFSPPLCGGLYLIKTDSLGDTLWTKTHAGGDGWAGHSGKQTTDGGYIIAGNGYNKNGSYGLILEVDEYGDSRWIRGFGSIGGGDEGYGAHQAIDGAYVNTGSWYHLVTLMKWDTTGNNLWMQTYENGMGYFVQQTFDSGYIVAGLANISNEYDAYLVKTDTIGDTLWTRTYGSDSSDVAFSIQQTSDGGYIIAGNTRSFGAGGSDVWIIRTNSLGDSLWTKTYGGTGDDGAHSICRTNDGGYAVLGYTESYGAGGSDLWLLKIEPDIGVVKETNNSLKHSYGSTFFSGPLLLPEGRKCKVFDITGRVVAPDKIRPGIYFIEADGKITRKVVKVR